jgi:hypothetical protein
MLLRLLRLEQVPSSSEPWLLQTRKRDLAVPDGLSESARRIRGPMKSSFLLARMRGTGKSGLLGEVRAALKSLNMTFRLTCRMQDTSTYGLTGFRQGASAVFAYASGTMS